MTDGTDSKTGRLGILHCGLLLAALLWLAWRAWTTPAALLLVAPVSLWSLVLVATAAVLASGRRADHHLRGALAAAGFVFVAAAVGTFADALRICFRVAALGLQSAQECQRASSHASEAPGALFVYALVVCAASVGIYALSWVAGQVAGARWVPGIALAAAASVAVAVIAVLPEGARETVEPPVVVPSSAAPDSGVAAAPPDLPPTPPPVIPEEDPPPSGPDARLAALECGSDPKLESSVEINDVAITACVTPTAVLVREDREGRRRNVASVPFDLSDCVEASIPDVSLYPDGVICIEVRSGNMGCELPVPDRHTLHCWPPEDAKGGRAAALDHALIGTRSVPATRTPEECEAFPDNCPEEDLITQVEGAWEARVGGPRTVLCLYRPDAPFRRDGEARELPLASARVATAAGWEKAAADEAASCAPTVMASGAGE